MKTATLALIDDDADEHKLFKIALSEFTPDLLCFYFFRCSEAFEYFKDEYGVVPDFIFVDWKLAEIEGKDCILNLRQIPNLEKSSMYIYSGVQDFHMQRRYLEDYDIQFLAKQNSVSELSRELKQITMF